MTDLTAITNLIKPEADALGFEMVRVQFISGADEPTLQVMAERPDTGQLGIDDCAALSRRISGKFDELEEQGNDPIPEQALGAHRFRPTGMALVRQKLWRGINEIRFPLPVLARVLTGRARPTQIRFEHAALSGTMQNEQDPTKERVEHNGHSHR